MAGKKGSMNSGGGLLREEIGVGAGPIGAVAAFQYSLPFNDHPPAEIAQGKSGRNICSSNRQRHPFVCNGFLLLSGRIGRIQIDI
jgi:hypothetical protein